MMPVSVTAQSLAAGSSDNAKRVGTGCDHRDPIAVGGQDLRRRDAGKAAHHQRKAGAEQFQPLDGGHESYPGQNFDGRRASSFVIDAW